MEQKKKSGGNKPWKSKKEKKRMSKGVRITLFVVLGLLLVLLIGAAAAAIWANHYMNRDPEQRADTDKILPDSSMFEYDGELPDTKDAVGRKPGFYNILIIGRDKVALNTDVIMCASFDITQNKAATVQIPRDSYVKDKNGNTSKINAVFARGYSAARKELTSLKQSAKGKSDTELAELCQKSDLNIDAQTLRDFADGKIKQDALCTRFGMEFLQDVITRTFGIYFDYYAVVSTDAFVKIVDAVGGVDVNVQENMDYEDPEQDLYIHIKKGPQHLNGKQAEGFVRFRHGYVQADIARMDAQKIFLTAFFKKLLSFSSVTRVDDIVRAVYDSVDTDMSLENALGFVKPALGVELSEITMLNMQGTPYRNGMYYSLNKTENLKIVNAYFNVFTHDLSANAVSVEELVQSSASDSDSSKGRTMEDIDENQIDLGFIKGGGYHGGNEEPEPSVPVIAQPDDPNTDAEQNPEPLPDGKEENTENNEEDGRADSENGEKENPPSETGESSSENPSENPTENPSDDPSHDPSEGSTETGADVPPPAAA